jgi:hypothetical protein
MNVKAFRKCRLPACIVIALLGMLLLKGVTRIVEAVEIPGTIVIDHIQKQYGSVTFDHTMHAGLAGNCGKCHHQHSEKTISVCKECHALNADAFKSSVKEGFLPCSGCHSEYSPDAPGMPSLKVAFHKKCFECHVGIGELGSSPRGCSQTCHTKKSI